MKKNRYNIVDEALLVDMLEEKYRFMRILFIAFVSICSSGIFAQVDTIKITNSSFEESPRAGGVELVGIRGWYDCGIINFPNESAPDIHPMNFWENTKQASHGKTYLGMVVRDNDSWESLSQRLTQPVKAGNCYAVSVDISRSERYKSGSRRHSELNGDDKTIFNYTTPTVLRIWGGAGYCDTRELLAETVPVNHSEWKAYNFKLSPTLNHKFITIEAFYKVPILVPYNGHILVDNFSQMVQIDCEEEIIATAEVKAKKKIPPHKRIKKKPKKKKEQDVVLDDAMQPTLMVTPPKKILNLDRSKLKKGQTVKIKNLYFGADTTQINKDSYFVLDEVFDFLNTNKDITVEIGGHTNNQPPHSYCDKLSQDRAKEVAVYLVQKGIDGDRIYYKGYGKRKAVASNLTKKGRLLNQRVEIKILSMDS